MPTDIEHWLPISGFHGYEVSNLGRVRSFRNSRGRSILDPKYLVGSIQDPGYPIVNLRCEGKTHKRFVHRLVLEAFVGPCPNGWVTCHHPDNDRTNCRLDNLRWAPYSENENDKKIQGVYPEGQKHHNARLTCAQVVEIRKRRAMGEQFKTIVPDYPASWSSVVNACNRRSWKSVNDDSEAVSDNCPYPVPDGSK
jgi:hypothetical protein